MAMVGAVVVEGVVAKVCSPGVSILMQIFFCTCAAIWIQSGHYLICLVHFENIPKTSVAVAVPSLPQVPVS